MPEIPNTNLTREEVINLLFSSIAMEELSLSHLLNAEGEKIQKLIQSSASPEELYKMTESMEKTVRAVIKQELLLLMKLESVVDLAKQSYPRPPCRNVPPNKACTCEEKEEWDEETIPDEEGQEFPYEAWDAEAESTSTKEINYSINSDQDITLFSKLQKGKLNDYIEQQNKK